MEPTARALAHAAASATHLGLRLRADVRAPGAARAALLALGSVIAAERLDDLRLLVSEAVTNSIRHGGISPDGPIEIDVSVAEGRVCAEVRDRGRGFTAQVPALTARGSGWGLFLIDRIAERWGVEAGCGTVVWFELPAGD